MEDVVGLHSGKIHMQTTREEGPKKTVEED
jgi:hypothetical protein